ncbi:MAG TPA: SAM-dependent DNA methyltransferase, partial [Candidatus Atribacteria bacterium]|nr:SAM-dependent DNA methyltransferase [Candidatus Atribacteria bacterium]
LYLFIDKILFYNTLKIRYKKLKGIKISKSVKTGLELKKELQKYFNRAEIVTKDYETIFVANFIEAIPVPDEIVFTLKYFINGFSKYDFSKLGFRDIGRIFDRLIPEDKRHKLGQYFTRSDVVDLINGFCIRKDGTIVDFGCGAGTFLVRGYARLKNLYPEKEHNDLLAQLWGVDISKFAAHLSTISLAIRDLSEIENYPRVFCEDFFDIKPKIKLDLLPKRYAATRLDRMYVEEKFPLVDAVVGNPPYTRQEELEDYIPNYKQKIERVIKKEWKIKIGKRAGIHVYFFVHGASFLKEKGRFGYITSNSWLDVDYGKYLQEFFLKHFKIITVIESKIERWFADADVNTAITILERCYPESVEDEIKEEEKKRKREERDKNLVKFVQLKVPLTELIPNLNEEERWRAIDDLINFIENKNELYEDERIRVYPKLQKELWKEGYDEEKKQYIGSKWGKYIRAPDIFFKVLEKGKDLFVPLKEVAKIRRGFTTGANEFFYLTEEDIKKWGIEREFWMHKENGKWVPNYVIKSPRECTSIVVDPKDLKYRVLMIHKDKKELKGTNILRYIEMGEEQGFHKRPTCRSRRRWYDLGERKPGYGFWIYIINDRYITYLNKRGVYVDCELFDIYPKIDDPDVIIALLNSSLTSLFSEVEARLGLGLGALKKQVYEIARLLVLNPLLLTEVQVGKLKYVLNKLSRGSIGSVFEEIGASSPEEVSLDKVKPDRRELDKIIMEDILGLTEEEELEVYRAVVDLVKSRIEKAKSVKKMKKGKGPDPEILAEGILKELELKLKKFP